MLFITETALFTAAVATFRIDELTESESLIVESTLLSDLIVSAIDQVEALSAAVEIFNPVEICFCVTLRDCCVIRKDSRAVMADEFVRMLDMIRRSLV
jgi:hypothetical protein